MTPDEFRRLLEQCHNDMLKALKKVLVPGPDPSISQVVERLRIERGRKLQSTLPKGEPDAR